MRINDYIKINVNDPENEPLLKVDYYSLLPMFDKYYTRVFQGDVLFIDFPYIDKQYVELSRKYYMEGIADLTVLTMSTIYDLAIDRKEHRFVKIRPVRIDTGQTIFISGPARRKVITGLMARLRIVRRLGRRYCTHRHRPVTARRPS